MTQPTDIESNEPLATAPQTYLQRLLQSLSIPAYRWLWFNSLFGTMRLITVFVARGWLVLTLTDSPFWVGAAPAMRGITQIALGLFAGVLLDRINRRTALLVAEVGTSVVAFSVGFLVLTEQITLWHILVASVIEGAFMSVRWPAINTMLFQAVGPKRVLNASAAQMLGFNLGNVIASGAAGVIIAAYGVDMGYFFAAACGLVAAVCVLFIRGEFRPQTAVQEEIFESIRGGLVYIRDNRSLMLLIVLALLMSLLGWSSLSMLPVMARDVLSVDASGLGFLTAAGAIGSLISTAVIAGLGDHQNKTRLVLYSGVATTVGILLFALSSWYSLSLVLIALMQAALMSFEVTITASVILLTAEHMQGRVQGLYTQVFGFTWVGGVLLGSIATVASAPIAIFVGGIAIGIAVLAFWRPLKRASYDFG